MLPLAAISLNVGKASTLWDYLLTFSHKQNCWSSFSLTVQRALYILSFFSQCLFRIFKSVNTLKLWSLELNTVKFWNINAVCVGNALSFSYSIVLSLCLRVLIAVVAITLLLLVQFFPSIILLFIFFWNKWAVSEWDGVCTIADYLLKNFIMLVSQRYRYTPK